MTSTHVNALPAGRSGGGESEPPVEVPRARATGSTAGLIDHMRLCLEGGGRATEVARSMLELAMAATGRRRGLFARYDDRGHAVVEAREGLEATPSQLADARGLPQPQVTKPDDRPELLIIPLGDAALLLDQPLDIAPSEQETLQIAGSLAGLLGQRLTEIAQTLRLNAELRQLRDASSPSIATVLASSRLVPVRRKLKQAARARGTVFLQGEEGTEKEDLARWLHQSDPRTSACPFVPFYVSSIPAHRIEEELFGPGDPARGRGSLAEAHTGTLFVDRPEQLPAAVQERLARALADSSLQIRLVAASTRSLGDLRNAGSLQQPLADLLNDGVRLVIPALRERTLDVPSLVDLILREMRPASNGQARTISDKALRHLISYPWPGNVRELRQVLESAAARAGSSQITPKHLPDEVQKRIAAPELRFRPLREIERDYITDVVYSVPSKREAAKVLGIAPSTLYEKLHKYKIQL